MGKGSPFFTLFTAAILTVRIDEHLWAVEGMVLRQNMGHHQIDNIRCVTETIRTQGTLGFHTHLGLGVLPLVPVRKLSVFLDNPYKGIGDFLNRIIGITLEMGTDILLVKVSIRKPTSLFRLLYVGMLAALHKLFPKVVNNHHQTLISVTAVSVILESATGSTGGIVQQLQLLSGKLNSIIGLEHPVTGEHSLGKE